MCGAIDEGADVGWPEAYRTIQADPRQTALAGVGVNGVDADLEDGGDLSRRQERFREAAEGSLVSIHHVWHHLSQHSVQAGKGVVEVTVTDAEPDSLARLREAVHSRVDALLATMTSRRLAELGLRGAEAEVYDEALDLLADEADRAQEYAASTRGVLARGSPNVAKQVAIADRRARTLSMWLAYTLNQDNNVRAFRDRVRGWPLTVAMVPAWMEAEGNKAVAEELEALVDLLHRNHSIPWTRSQCRAFVLAQAIPLLHPLIARLYVNPATPPVARRVMLSVDPSLTPDVVAHFYRSARRSFSKLRRFPADDTLGVFAEFALRRLDEIDPQTHSAPFERWRIEWNQAGLGPQYSDVDGFRHMATMAVDWVLNVLREEGDEAQHYVWPPEEDPFVLAADGTVLTLDRLAVEPILPVAFIKEGGRLKKTKRKATKGKNAK